MSGGVPPRILVIRGGALGDFILTLPAIGLLRQNFPTARIEILGYRQFVAIAEQRFYADAVRSIEYGPLATFFARNAELPNELVEYFAGFAHVFSYLFDPDGIFAANLRRAGVKNLVTLDPRPGEGLHAAFHLARPMENYALFLDDPGPRIHPTAEDQEAAGRFLEGLTAPFVAVHPGSGGARKNWPVDRWVRVAEGVPGVTWIVTGGEADGDLPERLASGLPGERVRVARDLPLPLLGALFSRCSLFLGNDSGISHLAAAAGIPCLLVFGPTDPAVWAPRNAGVRVIEAPGGNLDDLDPAAVIAALPGA